MEQGVGVFVPLGTRRASMLILTLMLFNAAMGSNDAAYRPAGTAGGNRNWISAAQ